MSKLPARYNAIALPLVLSFLMTNVVSGIATWRAVGLVPNFLHLWMTAWALSWLVAFPAVLIMLPVSRRIVAALVHPPR